MKKRYFKPRYMFSIVVVFATALIITSYPTGADEIPELTPEKVDRCAFKSGERLVYEFGWNGIPAAKAVFIATRETVDGKSILRLRTETKTIGGARLLWKMDDWAESIVHPNTLKPLGYIMHQEEAGDLRHSVVEFDHERGVAKVTRQHKKKTKKKEISFQDAYDPLSFVYLLRCIKFEVGKRKVMEIVDGNHTYRIILDVEAAEPITIKTGNYAAYRVRPSFVRVPPPKKPEEKILYKAHLWIDIEPPYHVLRIKSKVMVGNVYGELVSVGTQ